MTAAGTSKLEARRRAVEAARRANEARAARDKANIDDATNFLYEVAKLAEVEVWKKERLAQLREQVAAEAAKRVATHRTNAGAWVARMQGRRYAVDPTHLKIAFRKAPPPGGWKLNEAVPASYFLLPLFDDEGKRRWREHDVHGAKMDAVVLRLSIAERDNYAIDAYLMGYGAGGEVFGARLWPAQDVFIVGYPYGLESGFLLPLWVRGTIASEPLLMYPYRGGEMPMFLVDARTRDGQSGSPVILFAHPRTPFVQKDGNLAYTIQAVSRILGVYSGRTSHESDLGFVWRIEEIDAMCRAELSGTA